MHQAKALLDLRGDSAVVIGWLTGRFRCKDVPTLRRVAAMQGMLHEAWGTSGLVPAELGGQWARHVLREGNRAADSWAPLAVEKRTDKFVNRTLELDVAAPPWRLQASFDGGKKKVHAGSGFVVEIIDAQERSQVLCAGCRHYTNITAMEAELRACEMLIRIVVKIGACQSLAYLRRVTSD